MRVKLDWCLSWGGPADAAWPYEEPLAEDMGLPGQLSFAGPDSVVEVGGKPVVTRAIA
jgi:hypothetical protein